MPNLILESDEILPDTPAPLEGEASGPFPIFWRGKERQFLLRVVELLPKKHVIFVRELAHEMAGNWMIHQEDSMKPIVWSPAPPRRVIENISDEFARRNWALGRFFAPYVSYKKAFGALLTESGVGTWLNRELLPSTHFDFAVSSENFVSNRNTIQRFWQRENVNPDSTIGFSVRWLTPHQDEVAALVLGQNLAEIAEVMRWVLLRESLLWERDNSWKWDFRPLTSFDSDFSWLLCKHGALPLYPFAHIAARMPVTHAATLFLEAV